MDLLMSGDMLVADADETLARLIDTLAIPEPRTSWTQRWIDYGFIAHWCRIGPDFSAGPTRLEVISPAGVPPFRPGHPHMRELFDGQGDRPVKAHSTPVSVPDLGPIVERLRSVGARFRLDPPMEAMGFERLWMGVTEAESFRYLPDSDGGLRLEFLPTSALGLPPEAASAIPPTLGPPDGSYVGVSARVFLTANLDAACSSLARNFGWEPLQVRSDDRGTVATFGFAFARSGVIEILQPSGSSEAMSFLEQWGDGPYGIRLAVNGLSRRVALLSSRSTRVQMRVRDGRTSLTSIPMTPLAPGSSWKSSA
ncbi:MAG: hypothetical protein AB7Q27_21830 [Acidimicrobiia bacterium]